MVMMSLDQSEELIPGLPDDVAVECLSRAHYSTHHHASSVSRSWRHLLHSSDFYRLRRKTGHAHLAACLIQALPSNTASGSDSGLKSAHSGPPAFGISLFDSVTRTWDRVGSFPTYPYRLPLFCHVTSYQGKLILMGGWDPETYDPVTDVFIYDFRATKWARGCNMPSKRSLFAIGSINGLVLIAGGHDESKNALNSSWSYNIDTDKWTELSPMTEPRDECSGVMKGPEFWVVSGYETESQGGFKQSADVYDTFMGEWRREDGVWEETCHSPRSVLGTSKDGGLFSWAAAGTCAVELGDRTLVSGSEECGFFVVERLDGEMKKLDVPDEFTGFVQSGCCIEI